VTVKQTVNGVNGVPLQLKEIRSNFLKGISTKNNVRWRKYKICQSRKQQKEKHTTQ